MSHERWQAIWSRRGPAACLLWPVAQIYTALMAIRRQLYLTGLLPIHRLPVPVVVVGNVVVGGAGKTPTVIALVQHLQAAGRHPGVISRGYGRASDAVLEVRDATPPSDSGDEPALIRRRTGVPVFVAPHRADAGRALLATYPQVDILLCDDGLQHLALGRDIALAVFDERGTGNGWTLPAGLLREPWPPGSGHPFQPDLLLQQRRPDAAKPTLPSGHVPAFEALRSLAAYAVGPQGQQVALSELVQRPLTALAGIARPTVFFDMLSQQGLDIRRRLSMADHAGTADYAALDLSSDDTVICTEKDAVKLFPLLPPGVQAWAVPLELSPEPAFWTAFDAMLALRVHAVNR